MKRLSPTTLAFVVVVSVGAARFAIPQGAPKADKSPAGNAAAPYYLSARFQDLKWEKMFPEFADTSPEITILRVDPKTQATQLLIRNPKKFHVPRHWHSANETHTILSGTYVFECDGKRDKLGPGSFNYVPSRVIHQAWAPERGLIFITVDGAWDINWVEGPPKPAKEMFLRCCASVTSGLKRPR